MKPLIALALAGAVGIALMIARSPATPQPGAAVPQTYLVVHVRDADTIEVETPDGLRVAVRFVGVDAPDRGQPGFAEGKAALAGLLLGRRVRLDQQHPRPLDKYNRVLGRVWLDGLDVEAWLVEQGHALPRR